MSSSLRKRVIIFVIISVLLLAISVLFWAQNTGKIQMFADVAGGQSFKLETVQQWNEYSSGSTIIPYLTNSPLIDPTLPRYGNTAMQCNFEGVELMPDYAPGLGLCPLRPISFGFSGYDTSRRIWISKPITVPSNFTLNNIKAMVNYIPNATGKVVVSLMPGGLDTPQPISPDQPGWKVYYERELVPLGSSTPGSFNTQDNGDKYQPIETGKFMGGAPFYVKVEFANLDQGEFLSATPMKLTYLAFNYAPAGGGTATTAGGTAITEHFETSLNYSISAAPDCNTSSSSDYGVSLTWGAFPNAGGYDLVRINLDGSTNQVFSNVGTQYTDRIPANTSYQYQASAYVASMNNGAGGHVYSNVVTVPKACSGTAPTTQPGGQTFNKGFIDTADCTHISGWACDAADFNAQLTIHIYDGPVRVNEWSNNVLNNVVANISNPADSAAISNLCGQSTVGHRFDVPTPDKLKDGKSHNVYAYPIRPSTGSGGLPLASGVVNQSYVVMNACTATTTPTPTTSPTVTPTTTPTPVPSPTSTSTVAPNTPTNLKAEAIDNQSIKLSWDSVSSAEFYNIYNSGDRNHVIKMESISKTSTTISGLACGAEYPFVIQAGRTYYAQTDPLQIHTALSGFSNEAKAKTKACKAGDDISNETVNNLKVEVLDISTVKVSWDAVDGANGYEIFTCDGNLAATTSGTDYTFKNVVCGSNQCFYVVAHSVNGTKSKPSEKKSITMPQCKNASASAIKGISSLSKTGSSLWFDIAIAMLLISAIGYFFFRGEIWKPKGQK